MRQAKQPEWHQQWTLLQDDSEYLFKEWISPYTLDDFKNKEVLECGCGGGQHTSFMAPFAKSITAVDLNTTELAKKRNSHFTNITFLEGDIANVRLDKKFDIVICIGVLQHTDNPDQVVENMKRHLKPGGLLLIWCYSKEGNFLVEHLVEPIRKMFLKKVSRKKLLALSKLITAILYIPIYSLYLTPIKKLPFYEYFQNFRKLSFYRNTLNVFDKLNAPQTVFFDKQQATDFTSQLMHAKVLPYKGVSWRISGKLKDN